MPTLVGTWQSHWSEAREKQSVRENALIQGILAQPHNYSKQLLGLLASFSKCLLTISASVSLTLPNAACMVHSLPMPHFQRILGGAYNMGRACPYAGCSEGLIIGQASGRKSQDFKI